MLPDNFRFVIQNETGVTIDASKITIKYRGKYFDTASGKLTFETESSDVANQGGTISDGAYNTGTTIDNGAKTNPILEADVHVDFNLSTNTATPNGFIYIHLQKATADSPVWPTNGEIRDRTLHASVQFTSKTDKDITFTVD